MLRKDIVTKLTRRNKLIKNAIDLTILSEHEAKSGCFLKAIRGIADTAIADTAGICITKAMNRPLAALQRRPPSLG